MSTLPSASSARHEVRQVAPKLIELITHLAFYAGWPAAMTTGRIARNVFDGGKS